ncbi:MAG: hypothetical protein J2P48_10985 [Alphaproteobacteria bacterium]|nr:hypothetical protein [Alphaproteobacteria bacterium]
MPLSADDFPEAWKTQAQPTAPVAPSPIDPNAIRPVDPYVTPSAPSITDDPRKFGQQVGTGIARGAASLVQDVPGVPSSWGQFANAPSTGGPENVGRFIGQTLPFAANPFEGGAAATTAFGRMAERAAPYAWDFLAGAAQPTQSGTAESRLAGGLAGLPGGAVTRGIGKLFTASPDVQTLLQAGVRPTPGRMLPAFAPSEWLLRRIGGPAQIISRMENLSNQDLNRFVYNGVLETLPNAARPTATGRQGLDELYNTIVDQLNTANPNTWLDTGAQLNNDIAAIRRSLERSGVAQRVLDGFDKTVNDLVHEPIQRSGIMIGTNHMVSGQNLTGPGGIIPKLRADGDKLWRSADPQQNSLAHAIDDLEDTLLKNTQGPGKAQRDAARQAYARYKTLERSVHGATTEGMTDPQRLLTQMEKENKSAFARGTMRGQSVMEAARRVLPTLEQQRANPSWWETMAFYTGGPLLRAATGDPRAYGELVPLATLPAYTKVGRDILGWMAKRNLGQRAGRRLHGPAAAAASQAIGPAVTEALPHITVTPLPSEQRVPEAR